MINTQIKNKWIETLLESNITSLTENIDVVLKDTNLSHNYTTKALTSTKGYINSKLYDIEYIINKDNKLISVIPRIYVKEFLKQNTVEVLDITVVAITKDTYLPIPSPDMWENKAVPIPNSTEVYLHYKNYDKKDMVKLLNYIKSKGYTKVYLGFEKIDLKLLQELKEIK